jgi:hypothetical protein
MSARPSVGVRLEDRSSMRLVIELDLDRLPKDRAREGGRILQY